jgi:acetoin utilization protein AcuB
MADLKNAKVVEYSSSVTHKATPDTNLLEISQQLEKNNIRHMPIVQDDKFVGIISDRDIKLLAGMQRADELTAKEIMNKDIYVVGPKASLNEGITNMINKKIDSVLIEDGAKLYIFTSTDALNIIKILTE